MVEQEEEEKKNICGQILVCLQKNSEIKQLNIMTSNRNEKKTKWSNIKHIECISYFLTIVMLQIKYNIWVLIDLTDLLLWILLQTSVSDVDWTEKNALELHDFVCPTGACLTPPQLNFDFWWRQNLNS